MYFCFEGMNEEERKAGRGGEGSVGEMAFGRMGGEVEV
jgi:hypothetical protein